MTENIQAEVQSILHDIGFQTFPRKYSLIQEIGSLFSEKEKLKIIKLLDTEQEAELSRNKKDDDLKLSFSPYYEITRLTRFFLLQTFSQRKVDFFENLKNPLLDKRYSLLVAMKISNLVFGAYELLNTYNQREFHQVILDGNISSDVFLSFHTLNYLYQKQSSLILENQGTSNISGMLRMMGNEELYEEKNLHNAKIYISTVT